MIWPVLVVTALVMGTFWVFHSSGRRSPLDVISDLSDTRDEEEEGTPTVKTSEKSKREVREEELLQAGFFKREERIKFERQTKRFPFIVGALFGGLLLLFTRNPLIAMMGFSLGLCGGYLYVRRALYNRKRRFLYDIDYYLPVVMERLVMTAQAGLDVFSGIRVVSELARSDEKENGEPVDPVTLLLERVYHLNERGVGFEEALSQVSQQIESPPLRHAFIHLAVAQKEGGELVSPLRELSDSTQAYFQETIEEQIAKLPVKATLPLLLTFAGLVIFFMTSPMMQILKLSSGGIPK